MVEEEKKREKERLRVEKKGKASLRRGVGREGEMGGDKEMATERAGSSPSSLWSGWMLEKGPLRHGGASFDSRPAPRHTSLPWLIHQRRTSSLWDNAHISWKLSLPPVKSVTLRSLNTLNTVMKAIACLLLALAISSGMFCFITQCKNSSSWISIRNSSEHPIQFALICFVFF